MIRLDDWEPVPLAVATLMTKSLTIFPIAFLLPIASGYGCSQGIGKASGSYALPWKNQ
jgi:hypothetical protein